MGRTTVYRTDVEKARNALIARGINPSLDAIRVELGNTGSKSTIHKFLREIEGEEAVDGDQEKALGNEISELVAKLAARLKHEADARVAEIRAAADTQLDASATSLAKEKAEVERLTSSIDRLEASLGDERAEHAQTRDRLQAATVTIHQLEERIAGLERRIVEHEGHAASLETKHEQARQTLEHFRTAAKEQREQELARHEHQVQGLQLELRKINELLTSKNVELLKLNKDNVRLIEQSSQLTRDLQQVRAEARQAEREVQDLKQIASEHDVLKARWAADTQSLEHVRADLAAARADLERERESRRHADAASSRTNLRLEAIEAMFKKLEDKQADLPLQPSAGSAA